MKTLDQRPQTQPGAEWSSIHPVVARALLARGASAVDAQCSLDRLAPPNLKGLSEAVAILLEGLAADRRFICSCDFDSDGAHSAAVIVRGLRLLGARHVDYVVPDRFTMGYGLTRGAVDLAIDAGCDILISVDCGISNVDGVAYARSKGLVTIVTDHHEVPDQLPNADAIINPKLHDCPFPSKALAGCGVAFYLMVALRAALRDSGRMAQPPSLADLLMYVATGTIGDLVPLDPNNRILVRNGIRRIRGGRAPDGYQALAQATGTPTDFLGASDLAFRWVPALNAAGRLANMRTGIDCLLSDDPEKARAIAAELVALNRERKEVQAQMTLDSEYLVAVDDARRGICVMDPSFHQGVVGLVASKLKERHFRPVMAFAPAGEGELKGSGRSIPGLNIRDAMLLAGNLAPGSLIKGGGHAAACGASVAADRYDAFALAFDAACARLAPAGGFEQKVMVDGTLSEGVIDLELARALEEAGPWGQGFEEPLYQGDFKVLRTKAMGADGTHVRYTLDIDGQSINAVHFGGIDSLRTRSLPCLYRLSVNRWNGREELQLRIEEVLQ